MCAPCQAGCLALAGWKRARPTTDNRTNDFCTSRGKHGSITVSRLSDAEWGAGVGGAFPSDTRTRDSEIGSTRARRNRLFRLDVVAVKGTADGQGWTKDRSTKRGSNVLPIR